MPRATHPSAKLIVNRQTALVTDVDLVARESLGVQQADLGKVPIQRLLPEFPWTDMISQVDQNDKTCAINWQQILSDGSRITEVSFSPLVAVDRQSVLVELRFEGESTPKIAHRDALTGLPDRRALQPYFDSFRKAPSSEARLAVVFLDLDHFKDVNDNLGHEAGDAVLVALAERWQRCVRDDDLVVRYGGDEFVILLSEVASRDAAQPIIQRLIEATKQPIQARQQSVQVGVSIGVAFSESVADDFAVLLATADQDMYANKKLNEK